MSKKVDSQKKDGTMYKDVRIQFFVTQQMNSEIENASNIIGIGKNEFIRNAISGMISSVLQK